MLLSNKEEEVLSNLGLTLSQAKVYLTLIRKGSSKVADISQESKICREHLYPLLNALEKMGLVEKQLGTTTIYVAAPPESALPVLVQNKQQEVSELKTKVKEIMEAYTTKKWSASNTRKIKREITVTSNRERSLNKVRNCFENAKSKIELVHTWKRFVQFWDYYEETLIDAMSRGVKIRQIAEYPANLKQMKLMTRQAFLNKNFELRFINQVGGNIALLDNERIYLSTTHRKENLGQTPLVSSNYEGFVGVMQHYFKLTWKTARHWTPTMDISETSNPPHAQLADSI
ncbi:MAG: hypothetical protein NWF05_01830 [Candidatus Bathyarchaeota archaeon]|nr:hypothetical protein [Candidatus Bathyarchaeota archaeon]